MADAKQDAEKAHSGLRYSDAGVDIDAGNDAVARIGALVRTTRRPEQLDAIGGFAGMFALPKNLDDPVLVSCTDGVGTKLLVAIAADSHATVGIDLVAMSVNDLVVTGAEPLFVLDYIATGALAPAHVEAIVSGVCEGCRQSGAALLGGETAELPGMYAPGHYDLAATAVGVVERAKILGPERVRVGDVVLGLASDGLHSNGYSLARKALLDPDYAGLELTASLPGSELTVGAALLRPTRIYVKSMRAAFALEGAPVHAAAHITGGGLLENPPRALDARQAVRLDMSQVPADPIFAAISSQGVSEAEMRRTFNCGVGMMCMVDAARADEVADVLRAHGERVFPMGEVCERADDASPQVIFRGA
ncbi:MAG: phosphoribosylformylglycinamidine cyclo-ligase [Nannocystaceae bacterium]